MFLPVLMTKFIRLIHEFLGRSVRNVTAASCLGVYIVAVVELFTALMAVDVDL